MQIALTKKLADAMGAVFSPAAEDENPLFSWTANWTKVWDNRRAEDMIVLVNNATRFIVAIYQVKRKNLKNVAEMLNTAISNTLLYMNLNPGIVEEYMRLAGKITFVPNKNRQYASWVTKAGIECSNHVFIKYNGIDKMFSDTVGAPVNCRPVNYSKGFSDSFKPYEAMFKALSGLTGKPTYKYKAFELLATLDLEEYAATRRIIVPANLELERLHQVLQSVFDWDNYHLYNFNVFNDNDDQPTVSLVASEEELEYDEEAVLMQGHVLSEFFPGCKFMRYTYDFGVDWEHEIRLVRVLEDYDRESPYLAEAVGQTPPEDVGGVSGYVEFRAIMLDPDHPKYRETKEWAGYWQPELSEWRKRPGVINI